MNVNIVNNVHIVNIVPNAPNTLNVPNAPNVLADQMTKLTQFEDLECWQEARTLVRMVYSSVEKNTLFQRDLRFTGQMTAAAVSIMNNIAEGWAAQSNAEFIRFLTYSRRSCAEVQNCAYIALDQKYLDKEGFQKIYDQALKTTQIIDGLLRYLRSKRSKRT